MAVYYGNGERDDSEVHSELMHVRQIHLSLTQPDLKPAAVTGPGRRNTPSRRYNDENSHLIFVQCSFIGAFAGSVKSQNPYIASSSGPLILLRQSELVDTGQDKLTLYTAFTYLFFRCTFVVMF